MNKAVFIDRDGTLIKNIPFNANPSLIEFEYNAIGTLATLKKNNFLLILISNQSGIAKGFFTIDALEKMHRAIQQTLVNFDAQLDAIYYCPHHPEGKIREYSIECDCRKPMPGLILQAASEHDIDLSNSWMIGDILNDVEAGNAAGCKTILQAASEHDIDLSNSWMIGDILNDVEAGNAAGCKTILLNNGSETEWIINNRRTPDFTVKNWNMIAQTILSNKKVVLNDG